MLRSRLRPWHMLSLRIGCCCLVAWRWPPVRRLGLCLIFSGLLAIALSAAWEYGLHQTVAKSRGRREIFQAHLRAPVNAHASSWRQPLGSNIGLETLEQPVMQAVSSRLLDYPASHPSPLRPLIHSTEKGLLSRCLHGQFCSALEP